MAYSNSREIVRALPWSELNTYMLHLWEGCWAEASTGMSLDSRKAKPTCAMPQTQLCAVDRPHSPTSAAGLWALCSANSCWCLTLSTAEVWDCFLCLKPPFLLLLPEPTEECVLTRALASCLSHRGERSEGLQAGWVLLEA